MVGISIVSDTNPLIYLITGNKAALDYLDDKQIWISAITELELYAKKGIKTSELEIINTMVNDCFIVDLNAEIKKIVKDLLQRSFLKLPDAIIAATAIYLDLPFLTADKSFKGIENLKLVLLEF